MAGDWLVTAQSGAVYNCTADSANYICQLDEVGEGTGAVLTGITPGIVLIVAALGIVGAIVFLIRRVTSNIGR